MLMTGNSNKKILFAYPSKIS